MKAYIIILLFLFGCSWPYYSPPKVTSIYKVGTCLWGVGLPTDGKKFFLIEKVTSQYTSGRYYYDTEEWGWDFLEGSRWTEHINSVHKSAVIKCPTEYWKLGRRYFKGLPE